MMLVLMVGALQPAESGTLVREQHALSVPNEIAPAVIPYLKCMVEDRKGRLFGPRNGLTGHAALELLKADCKSERQSAEIAARKTLTASNAGHPDNERMISTTLTSIDHAQDSVAERIDRTNPSQTDTSTPNGVPE
jgi:hypothetical protein